MDEVMCHIVLMEKKMINVQKAEFKDTNIGVIFCPGGFPPRSGPGQTSLVCRGLCVPSTPFDYHWDTSKSVILMF